MRWIDGGNCDKLIAMKHSPARWVAAMVLTAALASLSTADFAHAQACVGCTPLDDAAGPAYLGIYPLGLYPGSTNTPPPAHLALALAAAADIVPRNAAGTPAANGRIGFLSIGMSNTNQEFAAFERAEDTNLARNARIIIVDGAVGGQSADVIQNPAAPYWNIVDARVAASGLDPDQVQVVWLKEADGMVSTFTFPDHADTLEAHVRSIVTNLKDKFPQLQICFVSSRIYGGYSSNPMRNEPLSYETAFAFRNMIDAQITGDPTLNPDPSAGPVEAPVILWGPYLWANGTVPRASDGLTWVLADYEADNIHPSGPGENKVAAMLSGFFNTDVTAAPWYLADTADLVYIDAHKDAFVDASFPATNFGTLSQLTWGNPGKRAYLQFDLSSVVDSVVCAKLSMRVLPNSATGLADIVLINNTTWNETTITAATAPPFSATLLGTIPNASAGTAISLDVTAQVQALLSAAPGSAQLCVGVRAGQGPMGDQQVWSREGGHAPRLVLTTIPKATSVGRTPNAKQALWVTTAPNPVRHGASIILGGARAGERATVVIVDVRGAIVRTLTAADATQPIVWDGRDDRGSRVPSGVYFARASLPAHLGRTGVGKIVVLR